MPTFQTQNHKIFYREFGSGPLLLILPGNTASSICHKDEMKYFGQNYHVVTMDFWGTGQSERIGFFPDNWWEQGAHDASALAEHLGYQECMVMAEQVQFWKWAQGKDWQKVVDADSDFLLRFEKPEGFHRKITSYHHSRL